MEEQSYLGSLASDAVRTECSQNSDQAGSWGEILGGELGMFGSTRNEKYTLYDQYRSQSRFQNYDKSIISG